MDRALRDAIRLLNQNPELISAFLDQLPPLFVVATTDDDNSLHAVHGPFSSTKEADTYCETLTFPEERYLRGHITQLRRNIPK